MQIKYVFQSFLIPAIVAGIFAFISIFYSTLLFSVPTDGAIINFFSSTIITGEIETQGILLADIIGSVFYTVGYSMITFLIITLVFGFGWNIFSHFLNVDGPGKSKFYSIYWIINSAVLGVVIFALSSFVFFGGTSFEGAQFIEKGWLLTIIFLVYHLVMYYLIVLLGTARHNRSSVLFAFKLPGDL
tara:strand:- start:3597 stop:4157 length:561 start_codon:yes stop_codon:yes gene_type:complete